MKRKRKELAAVKAAKEALARGSGTASGSAGSGAAGAAAAAVEEEEGQWAVPEDEVQEEEEDELDEDVEFEFCDPDEEDFHAISELLKAGSFSFAFEAFSELSDSVAGQGNIGTLIKTDAGGENETVSALLTVLNLQQFKHLSWPETLRKALLSKATTHADSAVRGKLQSLLGDGSKQVGLLLSERFANLPPDLLHPLHKAMLDDIQWSCETPECPEDERPFYRFTHFLGVLRAEAKPGKAPKAGKKRRKAAPAAAAEEEAAGETYRHEEAEPILRRALLSFTFPAPVKRDADGEEVPELRGSLTFFAITLANYRKAVAELQELQASAEAEAEE